MNLKKTIGYFYSLRIKFLFFCIAGILSAIVDLISFNIFYYLSIPFILSRTLGVIFAKSFTFGFNRNLTFDGKGKSVKKQIPKHIIIYSLVLITNVTVSSLVLLILGENTLNANIASVVGIVAAIPISFFGSMLWTFK